MSVFEFNPLEVGNPMTLGLAESELEDKVMTCVGYLLHTYGEKMDSDTMFHTLDIFGIEYLDLPRWLQAEFDRFELVD